MATATRASTAAARPERILTGAASLVLVGVTAWACTAGPEGHEEPTHVSPATVEPIADGEFAWVTLTPDSARRIGLDVTSIRSAAPAAGSVLPYAALIHAADGTTWVYVTEGETLRFRRREVEVASVEGDRVLISDGPPAGTAIAGTGSAELYGTEFEVGH